MAKIDVRFLKQKHDPSEEDIYEEIRADLEDSLKEYSELDLVVELIQNALDAMDERRYQIICSAAEIVSDDGASIQAWNQTVTALMNDDYESFPDGEGASTRAVWQTQMSDEERRRRRWYEALVANLALDDSVVETLLGIDTGWAKLEIDVEIGSPTRFTIRDAGVGIGDPLSAFRHKSSTKRRGGTARRLGIRGSHGWGLSAILGLSNRVEVVSKVEGKPSLGLLMENFADFRARTGAVPVITQVDEDELATSGLPDAIDGTSGTVVRVTMSTTSTTGLLANLSTEGAFDQWVSALRLYTPIGQVNDYVLHPAFHCLRKNDLVVKLRWSRSNETQEGIVAFDYLRLSDLAPDKCVDLQKFVDGGMVAGKSVYCVGREKAGGYVYLVAGEIQASKPTLQSIEDDACGLLSYQNESGESAQKLPRGIFLALSGGMKSEYVALPAISTNAAFRGVILAESAQPTLGRKYTMDQRTAIPNGAKAFARTNEDVRKKTIPSGQPVITGPALHKWLRHLWTKTLEELDADPPFADTAIWAATSSGEAKVMLLYAELLGQKHFGRLKLLRCSLKDIYDFQFVYRWKSAEVGAPSGSQSQSLVQNGYVSHEGTEYRRLAIGEFKGQGDTILGEFDPSGVDWRKNPDSIDLLVCWDFDETALGEAWTSTVVDENNELREFAGQTHLWMPSGSVTRTRPLAVVSLKSLLEKLTNAGTTASVEDWRQQVGENYYD
jgi:hypothetical protein